MRRFWRVELLEKLQLIETGEVISKLYWKGHERCDNTMESDIARLG